MNHNPHRLILVAGNPGLETSAYRKHTTALLRRYFRLSLSAGRVASPLAKPEPRARVSSYRTTTFEDAMIFVHDMERCLQKLEAWALESIAAYALLELPREQAAATLNLSVAQADRRYATAVDRLSDVLLQAGIMSRNFDDPENDDCLPAARRFCRSAEPRIADQPVPRKPTASHKVPCTGLRILH
ncbi:MAG TPA: hypothetical protein VMT82_06285 [candidate division Zixibacteria bacterium]|nr:hypothetical protein [candidate division Zixibacteria bacterium]